MAHQGDVELHSAAQNEDTGRAADRAEEPRQPLVAHAADRRRREHLPDEVGRRDRGATRQPVTDRHEDVGDIDPDRGDRDVLRMGQRRVAPLVDERDVDLPEATASIPSGGSRLDQAQPKVMAVGGDERQGGRHQSPYRRRERRQPKPATDHRPGVQIRLDLLHPVEQVGALVGQALAVSVRGRRARTAPAGPPRSAAPAFLICCGSRRRETRTSPRPRPNRATAPPGATAAPRDQSCSDATS